VTNGRAAPPGLARPLSSTLLLGAANYRHQLLNSSQLMDLTPAIGTRDLRHAAEGLGSWGRNAHGRIFRCMAYLVAPDARLVRTPPSFAQRPPSTSGPPHSFPHLSPDPSIFPPTCSTAACTMSTSPPAAPARRYVRDGRSSASRGPMPARIAAASIARERTQGERRAIKRFSARETDQTVRRI
jgi:hypothetical protein